MPLTPTATRALLDRLGHRPRHALGQNFLVDGNIVRKSLDLAQIRPGDLVVEIGPGLGTLTAALLAAGARVWAIEKDPALHGHLSATLGPKYPDSLHLLAGDAIDHPLAGFEGVLSQKWTSREVNLRDAPSLKIVSNLPFAIATPWLDAVLAGPLPQQMVLMLQREAAQRYTAQSGGKSFGAISVFLQSAYDFKPGHKVAAACFYPRPEIESFLLNLVRKPHPRVLSPAAKAIIRACFQQRRKQIGGLLRGQLPDRGATWLKHLARLGLSPQSRPEAIPPEAWLELEPFLLEAGNGAS
jgi:16S rRNA (adenine1518-N6/adenine1519-N6)-dimethyltransferase